MNDHRKSNTAIPAPARRRAIGAAVAAAMCAGALATSAPAAQASGPEVILISRSVPVPTADEAVVERLNLLGVNLRLVDDDDVRNSGVAAIQNADVVLVSSTVYAARIGERLNASPTPILTWEHELYDELGMTSGATANGEASATDTIVMAGSAHPAAAGLSGNVVFAEKDRAVPFGIVGSGAEVLSTIEGQANKAAHFVYPAGASLPGGGSASGIRVGMFMTQSAPRHLTDAGWSMFDATVQWAAGLTPTTPAPVPAPAPAPAPAPTDPAPVGLTGGSEKLDALLAPVAGTHFGANASKRGTGSQYDSILAFEQKLGRRLSVLNRFHEFSAGVESNLFWDRKHIDDGRIVMLSWRATDNAGSTKGVPDADRAVKIVQGQFDTQIRAMAREVKELNAQVLIRFNWEMDQSPGATQYIGTPSEFIAAWRYVHDMFEVEGANNAVWVWAPRAASFNKGAGQSFYPGDRYVDWIGGSAVPIDSFRDPVTVYGAWHDWASQKGKPMLLWVGLRENPDDSQWKAKFLTDLQGLIQGPWSQVKSLVYYHANSPKGYDYWADTSTASWNAFRSMACSGHFATTHTC